MSPPPGFEKEFGQHKVCKHLEKGKISILIVYVDDIILT